MVLLSPLSMDIAIAQYSAIVSVSVKASLMFYSYFVVEPYFNHSSSDQPLGTSTNNSKIRK